MFDLSFFLPLFVKKKIFLKKNKNINLILSYKKLKFNFFNCFQKSNLFFNKNNNLILIKKKSLENNIKKSINIFNTYVYYWKYFIFNKIKFKGKGYKINYNKNKKTMKFFFNNSHINVIKFCKIHIKKTLKNRFILINKNKIENKNLIEKIKKIRILNIFTLRGLRQSKQIIYKRKGKKSSYI